MFNNKIKRVTMLIIIISIIILFFSCGPLPISRLGWSNGSPTQPAEVPKSLTGEILQSRTATTANISRTIDNWSSIFAQIEAEYGGFFQIALVAYNYSEPFEGEKAYWNQLINSPNTSRTTPSIGRNFTKEVLTNEGMFRTNDTYTEWEWITIGNGADTIRRHLRVSLQPGYTHTTLIMWHIGGMDSNDTIDIVETDKNKIIRCIEAVDLGGDGDVHNLQPPTSGGVTSFIEFYAITNKDVAEHTNGLSGDQSATINASLDYVMDGNYTEKVGGFDNSQLLIRPDVYPAPLTSLVATDGLSSQTENFDISLFPTLLQVQGVHDNVGLTPQEVAKGVDNTPNLSTIPSPNTPQPTINIGSTRLSLPVGVGNLFVQSLTE